MSICQARCWLQVEPLAYSQSDLVKLQSYGNMQLMTQRLQVQPCS